METRLGYKLVATQTGVARRRREVNPPPSYLNSSTLRPRLQRLVNAANFHLPD
jgi:hypothetical protein